MDIDDVVVYAHRDRSGQLETFSLSPGSTAAPIDRADPGGYLLLAAFATFAEARAYVAGIEHAACDAGARCYSRKFSENLTCVLVDFSAAGDSGLLVLDMRD